MRKWIIGLALASTAMATPALARDGQAYFELDGGVMKLSDIDFDIGAVDDAVEIDTDDWGYDFGAIVGYDFGGFRLEGEVGYRGVEQDELTSTVTIPAVGTTALTSARPGTFDAGGDLKALSFMVNALGDFGADDGLQFFAGAGAGYAKVDIDTTIRRGGPGFLDDDDWGFAWQLLAGVRAPLSDNIDVGVKYRFFNVSNLDFNDTAARDVDGDWRSHSLLGTFAVNFGGGADPMPEPVAVPPPPPEPAPVYTPPPPAPLPPEPAPQPRPAERG